jgi:superfamily I DNA/RNA helicase
MIMKQKSRGKVPADYDVNGIFGHFFQAYNRELQTNNMIDFVDMINLTIDLFHKVQFVTYLY